MKLVYCVRSDLKMKTGKIAAQVGHATVGILEVAKKNVINEWKNQGEAKIVCKIGSLQELVSLEFIAERNKIPYFVVEDAGFTQVQEGAKTVIAIGPASNKKLEFLDDLKLL